MAFPFAHPRIADGRFTPAQSPELQVSWRATQLRNRLLWALGAQGAGLIAACGTQSQDGSLGDDATQLAGADDAGKGTGALDATAHDVGSEHDASDDADGAMSDASHADSSAPFEPSLPEGVMCSPNFVQSACLDRAQLEAQLRQPAGWGGLPQPPEPPTQAEIDAQFLPNGCLPPEKVTTGCCNPALTDAEIHEGLCCYVFCDQGCCGRPFVIAGSPRLPGLMARRDWLGSVGSIPPRESAELTPRLRAQLAQSWLEDARMEFASVAAFARFTLELIGFGAPADLIQCAQQAGLDEIKHAQSCFAMAHRFSGEQLGPAPMRTNDAGPASTLRESVLAAIAEGCIGETLAAARAEAALSFATCPAARVVLERIAHDEGKHAELSYRFVAWALKQEPSLRDLVRDAFAAAFASVPGNSAELPESEAAEQQLLRSFGRLSRANERDIACRAWMDIIQPCARALLAVESSRSGRAMAHQLDAAPVG